MPRPAQTPLEFAAQASLLLVGVPPAFQDLPGQVARLFYRQRYGGETVPPDERLAARGRIAELDRLLSRPVANGQPVG
jgi:hypothetical protein